ncbi:MAG: trypsin-like peptidase domain-containing protein [candidate division KSB1 bacterium]|nr:trypsin-like peptidase domain-containing protein [candidate division KSB1 bacterium]MDZ7335395.1 trypsin-like peptidase domain-containing protein [candidate division KSB1 bacterium]MDZ7356425.1 trypsin-like peptidase domain-containing protein [candidate division KSB1 bacterium]MDZ7401196.1 trypsin-like peptidase domain-containing protein [candidate division KSB1 bacterium]
MKKIWSHMIVLVIGCLIGFMVAPKIKPRQQSPIFHTNAMPASYVATNQNPMQGSAPTPAPFENSRRNAITEAVRLVSPAVVGINVLQIREYRSRDWLFDDPFFRHFFPETRQQIVKGLGSGFIISPEGYIVTNEHVVNQAAEIVVTLPNGKKFQANVVASDYISDIALLKIDSTEPLPYVILGNSDDLIIGEWAIAFGNPFGLFDMGQPSVTQGIISATDRDFGKQSDNRVYKDMIQTDAAINSGNSGGPLVNSVGEVIGINTFIFSGSERTGTSIGLGFAIPINRAKRIIQELRQFGRVNRRFRTGLEIEDITFSLARYLGLRSTDGVIVSGVEKNSPASRAGFKIGDVIVAINEQEIHSKEDVWAVIDNSDVKGGDVLEMRVIRQGRNISLSLKLEEIR